MRFRKAFAVAGFAAGLLAALPAHAAGAAFGTGAVGAGCNGSLGLAAANSSGNNWVFDVSVSCTGSAPQHVIIAGQWDPATGGPVVGFGNGSLNVGKVVCGANQSVGVQVAMVGSPLRTGTASITRFC
ncbi:MAG TPA: hypothetical protein VM841_10165 [Actinomycetota bacterium]|nr:hypothetical protein [Actinomycetota bacterium]